MYGSFWGEPDSNDFDSAERRRSSNSLIARSSFAVVSMLNNEIWNDQPSSLRVEIKNDIDTVLTDISPSLTPTRSYIYSPSSCSGTPRPAIMGVRLPWAYSLPHIVP